ncbi:MAG: hypothetical protein MJ252_14375 [archaeon]|nr:hypothetical protein [archaeon]
MADDPEDTIFAIFNEIQTDTNTKDNLKKLYSLYESTSSDDFCQIIEDILLIVFYNYEKNVCSWKNIREFIKNFIENIVKNQKLKEKNKKFLKHFCELLCLTTKKIKQKQMAVQLLSIFLIPYSNGHINLYDEKTTDNIKTHLLNTLKMKTTSVIQAVIHLLGKHPGLKQDEDIWEILESLLKGENKTIKKEIIKLFENSNENITKYLLDMYDDDAIEVRQFAFEKLSKVKDFPTIDPKEKVKIFFIGLNEQNQKIKDATRKILRNYLTSLGITKSALDLQNERKNTDKPKDDDKMDLDEDQKDKPMTDSKADLDSNPVDDLMDEDAKNLTAKDKINSSRSPFKPIAKKLKSSPSRIFDELNLLKFYRNPKYSYVYTLITEAMLDIIDKDDVIEYCKDIIENISSIITKVGEIKVFSTEKKRKRSMFSATGGKEKIDTFALFSDLYFIQNCLNILGNENGTGDLSYKTDIVDILPDGSTFAKIIDHFYTDHPNIFIIHQLFLIAQHMPLQDEVGNREIMNFARKFIKDTSLHAKKITDFASRRLNFNPNPEDLGDKIDKDRDEDFDHLNNDPSEFNTQTINDIAINNMLLPMNRKVIFSMDDLMDFCLQIVKIIYNGKDNLLFSDIMEIVNELKDTVDCEGVPDTIKKRQNKIIQDLEDKIGKIDTIKEQLNGNNLPPEERQKLQKEYDDECEARSALDEQLLNLTDDEESILLRITTLCKFVVSSCKVVQQTFDGMIKDFIVPNLRKTNFPDLVHSSLEITGLLAINYYDSNYQNFLKLFFDNVDRADEEFLPSNRVALQIIFDSMLQNNLLELPESVLNGTIDTNFASIISKFLYHKDPSSRLLVFIGICKLLLADRLSKQQFFLSRIIVFLQKAFKFTDPKGENFFLKVHESMNNFLYFYTFKNKTHLKFIVKAINNIETVKLITNQDVTNDKTVLNDFMNIKTEFLNHMLYISFGNAKENTKYDFNDLIFKHIKYLYFLNKYLLEIENDTNTERKKTIAKTPSLYKNFKTKLKNYFQRNKYDISVVEYFKENDNYHKFAAFLMKMKQLNIIDDFSKAFADEYSELEKNGFKIEINSTPYDYSSDAKKAELLQYVDSKEQKYFEEIDDYGTFIGIIKEDKSNDDNDTSMILEVDEAAEMDESQTKTKKKGKKNQKKDKKKKDDEDGRPKKSVIDEEEEIIPKKKKKNKEK